MSHEVRLKIALGESLTEGEKKAAMSDSATAELARGMPSVDRISEVLRCEHLDRARLNEILRRAQDQAVRKGRAQNWGRIGYAFAALTILATPLAALLSGGMPAGQIGTLLPLFDQAKPTGRTAILTYADISESGKLEPINCVIVLAGQALKRGQPPKGQQKQADPVVSVPIRVWEQTPAHQRAQEAWSNSFKSDISVMGKPLLMAETWMGQKPLAPVKLAPRVLEINNKTSRLMGWRLHSKNKNRWVIAFGEKVEGRMPRLDFWEKRGGMETLVFRQDSFAHHEDILGRKVRFAPQEQREKQRLDPKVQPQGRG